MAPQHLADMPL